MPIEDPVTVPRGLLGAACSAIANKYDAPNTLEQLRQYTVGNHSASMSNTTQLIEQLVSALEANLKIYSAMYGVPINSESITHYPAISIMFKDTLEVLSAAQAHLKKGQ